MTKLMTRLVLAFLLSSVAVAADAAAPKVLGTFNDWEAYQLIEGNNQRTCYMASQPSKKEPGNVKRGDVVKPVDGQDRFREPPTPLVAQDSGCILLQLSDHLGFRERLGRMAWRRP